MRTLICATAVLLLSGNGCLAQVSTMGTTAMAIPTTPGAIVSSPLAGPSPFTSLFSAATIPGAPATTLASPPLALDRTLPGTSVNCAPTAVELSPSVESVTATSSSVSASPTAGDGRNEHDGRNGDHHRHVRAGHADDRYNPAADLAGGHASDHRRHDHRQHDRHGGARERTRQFHSREFLHVGPRKHPHQCCGLPASTPDIPPAPALGTIQPPAIDTDTADTSISPAPSVMPTPNTNACPESISMDLANPAPASPITGGLAATASASPPAGC